MNISYKKLSFKIFSLILALCISFTRAQAMSNLFGSKKKKQEEARAQAALLQLATALSQAIYKGDVEAVKNLVNNNTHIAELKNITILAYGNTVLGAAMHAQGPNRIALIKFLLEKGARVNVKDMDGNTPLLAALQAQWNNKNEQEEAITLLLKYGAEQTINAQDKDGYTALMEAVYERNNPLTALLLKVPNIDLTIKNNDNQTVHDIAQKKGDQPLIKMLHAKAEASSIPEQA